jgi:hypothetical protein
MSEHSSSAERVSVDWSSFASGPANGDFARLIPWNEEARRSFQQVVQLLENNPDHLSHIRGLIHWERLTASPDDLADVSDTSFLTEEEHPASPAHNVSSQGIATCGYYSLNMENSPLDMGRGWIVGSALNTHEKTSERVDFLLTPKYAQGGVRNRHCRLLRRLDKRGVMTIITDNSKVIKGL